ncbi:LysR family transcriptional regulator [Mangrovimicrobium sediminis]|uniref:LysR family transcriptional regulator n=1 Tax=Mangrovimicrobium sediminis TaxID=2562682 RepID=A0A4Z0M9L3_9GAMM|nr:LysR family transcriptional regulator [Haliea sp. SAOS-164]TGD75985.1 LysR family transcriptional regulator [Haliea sp. SAOS-164]
MNEFDFSSLDARTLKTLLVILEEGSISRAAVRMGVTQSAVSHTLEKLRLILGDPLFVRAGRGITPTERARMLREPVQDILDQLKALTDQRPFDPAVGALQYTIAANDFQRDLLFPGLLRRMLAEDVNINLRFIPSGVPATNLLRQARCQLIVTPMPPDGADIYQTRLFDDEVVCFYDSEVREAPQGPQAFNDADYIDVQFEDDEEVFSALYASLGMTQVNSRVTVPNFGALAAFLRDSDMLSLQLSLLSRVTLQGLASCPPPSPAERITMYMAWHQRDHNDPAHRWLREQIKGFAGELLST